MAILTPAMHPLTSFIPPDPIPHPPPLLYLHHPYHSSDHALPSNLSPPVRREPLTRDAALNTRLTAVVSASSVDGPLNALLPATTASGGQRALYTEIVRQIAIQVDAVEQVLASSSRSSRNTERAADLTKMKPIVKLDVFIRTLATLHGKHGSLIQQLKEPGAMRNGKGVEPPPQDGSAREGKEAPSLLIVVKDAHALPVLMGQNSWPAMLRLPELANSLAPTLTLSMILLSPRSYSDDLCLTLLGSSSLSSSLSEPLQLFLPQLDRSEIIHRLSSSPSAQHPLYPHFLKLLLANSLSLVPVDVGPSLDKLARVLWKVYSSHLVPHAEDHLLFPDCQGGQDQQGGVPEGQELKPFLRVTNPLLLELKSRTAHAFQAANESLLTGQVTERKFMDVFLKGDGRDKGKVGVDELGLGLAGQERDKIRAFLDLIPVDGGPPAAPNGFPETSTGTGQDPKQRPIIAHHLGFLVPLRPSNPSFATGGVGAKPIMPKPPIPRLPLFARFLLLAAYCASYNSPRSDLRMFGRGPIGSLKRKVDANGQVSYEASPAGGGKKKGGGFRKTRLSKISKVPQGLLGPKAFSLDRMLAIFMALVVEHGYEEAMALRHGEEEEDSEDSSQDEGDGGMGGLRFDDDTTERAARKRDRMRLREERKRRDWEDEVEEISRSVGLFGLIPELEKMRLLRRVSPRDRLDNIQIRCEAPKDMVMEYARSLKVDLITYLVEGE